MLSCLAPPLPSPCLLYHVQLSLAAAHLTYVTSILCLIQLCCVWFNYDGSFQQLVCFRQLSFAVQPITNKPILKQQPLTKRRRTHLHTLALRMRWLRAKLAVNMLMKCNDKMIGIVSFILGRAVERVAPAVYFVGIDGIVSNYWHLRRTCYKAAILSSACPVFNLKQTSHGRKLLSMVQSWSR